jgi:hypothetical protein
MADHLSIIYRQLLLFNTKPPGAARCRIITRHTAFEKEINLVSNESSDVAL